MYQEKSKRRVKTDYPPKSNPPQVYPLEEWNTQTSLDDFKIKISALRTIYKQ